MLEIKAFAPGCLSLLIVDGFECVVDTGSFLIKLSLGCRASMQGEIDEFLCLLTLFLSLEPDAAYSSSLSCGHTLLTAIKTLAQQYRTGGISMR